MGKKISVSKIIETNSDINIIFEELQKKMGYDTESDNHKQLIRMLFKLLDTEITNYVKTEEEKSFLNASKIITLIGKITSTTMFSENDAHLHLYRQARLLIKITGFIGEFLNEKMEVNLITLKERIGKIKFENEKELEKKFQTQIADLEKILEGKRLLKIIKENELNQIAAQNKENYRLFIQILKKCFNSIETKSEDIYYYLHMLHILENQTQSFEIDQVYYETLENLKRKKLPSKYAIILEEIDRILKRKHASNTPEEVIAKYDIATENSKESKKIEKNVQILSYKEVNPITISIDGDANETIKDDALSIRQEKDNYILGIHITDVGNFIIPNSPLDLSVKQKFKSIYLPNLVIHAIPQNISREYLSLEQGRKRNVISLYATINKKGEIEEYSFREETLIINQNLSYTIADKILRRQTSSRCELDYNLKLLEHVTSLLNNSQRNEYRFIKELIREIKTDDDPYSEKIVSESMILYNRLLAEYLSKIDNLPVIYRIHEKPETPSIEQLMQRKNTISEDFITILKEYYPKASYSLENIGHYGLRLDTYSHCSSPIRRYTDIFMQRLYFLSKQQLSIDELKQLEKDAIAFVEYANQKEKELKLFQDEYEQAYIKTFKPSDK